MTTNFKRQDDLQEIVTEQDSLKTIEKKELDYWLMNNIKLMEKLTVIQPACWCEADGHKE